MNYIKTLFLLFFISLMCPFPSRAQESDKSTVEMIQFSLDRGWPIVHDVYLNGEGPFSFMVDLGAGGIGRIDESLYKALKLEISGTQRNRDGFGNIWTQNTVAVDEIKLGSIAFSGIDLMMRDYFEDDIMGIIGRDFFANTLLVIDYPGMKMMFKDDHLNGTNEVILRYTPPLRVRGMVNGIESDFSIDTGSQLNFHFPKSFLIENDIPFEKTGKTTTLIKSGGEATGIEAIIRGDIIIGGIHHKEPQIWYSDLQDPDFINVGGLVLQNYIISLDQKNQFIQFTKPQ